MGNELDAIDRGQLMAAIREALPTPIEEVGTPGGFLRLTGGEPREVVVTLVDHTVAVAEFREDSKEPLPIVLGVIHWRSLPAVATRRVLAELLAAASAMRRSRFQACPRCGRVAPPELMSDQQSCRSCVEQDLEVAI